MAINQLILSVALKLFAAVIFAAVMIISLLSLSQDLHKYLGLFEHAEFLQFSIFSLIFLLCSLCLVLMLRKPKKNYTLENIKPPPDSMFLFDLKSLKMNFIEGFITGLTKPK